MSENKFKIVVCMGSSCFARGNDKNLEFIEKYSKERGIDADIELVGSRCESKCASGPNVIINGVDYNEVNEEVLRNALDKLAK